MAESSNRQKDIFLKALDLSSPAERAAFVTQACGSDESLRLQVEAMLQAHAASDSFLEKPAVAMGPTIDDVPRPPDEASEAAGTRVGPYKLLQQVGEGGMGTVWMAEQMEPVRRKVALKLIKPGMDSAQVIARFEAERQALALMDHPNIAKVLDAGATSEGRPYFVMELVKGIAITKYCDDNQLTPRERLALMIPVCQAVQHAHQKGLIHRDLKPSNVLIACYDGKPVPKVIDFGVAKAMGQQLTERTLFTGFGGIVGTLEYMSPEQAEFNALDVDTRSDIYSLGVLLYELLTGSPPLSRQRLKDAALAEVLRLIREEEPPKPSTRLSESKENLESLSAQRKLEPGKLAKEMRGELDWIVMKALEKDRGRRYETANGLAQDIERYLTDEPVQAGPPSAGYRLRKFVKRNRGTVTAAAMVLTTLLAGIAGTSWGWVEALWQRDDAVQARKDEADQRKTAFKAISDKALAEAKARALAVEVAETQKARADEADRRARYIDAHLALEKGTNRIDRGEIGPGLLWLIRGLEAAPDDAIELKRSLRLLLTAWGQHLHPIRASYESLGGHVAYDADGRRIMTAAHDTGLFVRDAKTGNILVKHKDPFATKGLAHQNVWGFSPDGRLLVGYRWEFGNKKYPDKSMPLAKAIEFELTYGSGKTLSCELIDTTTGERACSLTGKVRFLGFSGDSKTFLTQQVDERTLRLWDTATLKPLANKEVILPWRESRPDLAVLSPDGRTLLLDFWDQHEKTRLWDLITGKTIADLSWDDRFVCAAFSPNGKLLVTGASSQRGGRGWRIQVWDTTTGKPIGEPISYNSVSLRAVAFNPVGDRYAVATDWAVELWATPNLVVPQHHLLGRAYSFDGKRFVLNTSRSYPREETNAGELDQKLRYSADGQTLVRFANQGQLQGREETGTIHVFNGTTAKPMGEPIHYFGSKGEHGGENEAVALSPDGQSIAAPTSGGTRIYNVAREELVDAPPPPLPPLPPAKTFIDAVSSDGRRIVVLIPEVDKENKQFWESRVWDFHKSELIGAPVPMPVLRINRPVVYFQFSPNGEKLLYRDLDSKGIQEWDLTLGKTVGKQLPLTGVQEMVYSPDSKLIAVKSPKSGVDLPLFSLWNKDGKQVGPSPSAIESGWTALAISPDGKMIAGPLFEKGPNVPVVRLWDIATWKPIGEPFSFRQRVTKLIFSPDSQRLATLGDDKTIQIWDVASRKPVGEPMPGTNTGIHPRFSNLLFSPDGRLLVTQTANEIWLWDVNTCKLIGRPIPGGRWPTFRDQGKTLITFRDHSNGWQVNPIAAWRLPQPIQGDLERLRLWFEVCAGLELDAGSAMVELTNREWRERFDRLQKLGGPPTP